MLTPLLLSLACVSGGGDATPEWGSFRGTGGSGHAHSDSIPSALDPASNRRWRTELPAGYSSPIVAGDHIFVTGASKGKLSTFCLSRATGEIEWQKDVEFDGKRPGANSSAAPTPVTDGEMVYSTFHHAGIFAYDMKGEQKWHAELGEINIPHGLSASPLIAGGNLVQLVDQDGGSFLAAFDKKTGEEKWRTLRDAVHSYASPAVYEPAEGPAQIIVSGAFEIHSYSAVDGKKLWWVTGGCFQPKGIPVIDGDRCYVNTFMASSTEYGLEVFTTSWEDILDQKDEDGDMKISKTELTNRMLEVAWFVFDLDDDGFFDKKDWAYCQASATATGGLFAIDMKGAKGDVTESHVKWMYDSRKGMPDIPSPLIVGGKLFALRDGGVLTSFDTAKGEMLKTGRIGEPDKFYASPVVAAGRIVTVSHSGLVTVVESGDEWKELSTHDLGEEVWSTPAIAGGQVFIRSLSALHCFAGESEGE